MEAELSLNDKILLSKIRIQQWYEHWDGKVYVSFSGGKDSTVLLHLVRSMYPEVPAMFSDTGLEYPEIKDFVRTIPNVVWVKPKRNFRDVVLNEGYPVVSKLVSKMIRNLKNPTEKNLATRTLNLTGIKRDGTKGSYMTKLPKKWYPLIEADFKVTEKCCDILKKEPFKRYQKETGRKPFTGMMASEGALGQLD